MLFTLQLDKITSFYQNLNNDNLLLHLKTGYDRCGTIHLQKIERRTSGFKNK